MANLRQKLRDLILRIKRWTNSRPLWLRNTIWYAVIIWEVATFFIQIWLFGIVWGVVADLITTGLTIFVVKWAFKSDSDTDIIYASYPEAVFEV